MNSIEFAINMERDGEQYYLKQAQNNHDNRLSAVFMLLAEDENGHARLLKNELAKITYNLDDNEALADVSNVFKDREDFKKPIRKNSQSIGCLPNGAANGKRQY